MRAILRFHVSFLLTAVYKPGVTELAVFLEQTRSILHTLAHHAQEIERIIGVKVQKSAGTMPRDTRLLTLLYHQVRCNGYIQVQPSDTIILT
jgi:proline utilization trans-activator